MFPEDGIDRCPFGKVTFDKIGLWMDRLAMALAEIVEDDDRVAGPYQLFDRHAANIAGSTGHQQALRFESVAR